MMAPLEEDTFDPTIHLNYAPPSKIFTLCELGLEEDEYSTPIAGCTPFKFLSTEGVMAYRRAILKQEVFDRCAGYPFPGTVTLRNLATVSRFVHDLWTHPDTLAIMSEVLGTRVGVIMPTEIGHTNIQVTGTGDILDQLSVEPSEESRPLTEQEKAYDPLSGASVIPWQYDRRVQFKNLGSCTLTQVTSYDSYPYVCIIMLSDTTNMKGGETFIQGREIQAIQGPSLGSAVVLQGGKVKHLAARTFGAAERITTITSFRAAEVGRWDDSHLSNLRTYDDLQVLYQQWSRYRLKKMRDEIDATLSIIDSADKNGVELPRTEIEELCERLSEYSKRTTNQIVDPKLRNDLAAKHGASGIAAAKSTWNKIKALPNAREHILEATRRSERTMPEIRRYVLDWCQTRAKLERGLGEVGTQSVIVSDPETDYLLGDELIRQGLNEILLHWLDETGLNIV